MILSTNSCMLWELFFHFRYNLARSDWQLRPWTFLQISPHIELLTLGPAESDDIISLYIPKRIRYIPVIAAALVELKYDN